VQIRIPTPDAPRHFIRHDGYQVQFLPECDDKGLVAFHFVVKRTYDLEPDAPARPATQQRPLNLSDQYWDETDPLNSGIRYETDLLPPKPACDVIVNGHVYAPGGEAVQCVASVKVGDNPAKRVRVVGDRSAWLEIGAKRAEIQAARPFSVKPLLWQLSYGGVDVMYSAGPVPYPANPIGVGFWAKEHQWAPERERFGPLPNFEDADRPLQVDDLLVDLAQVQDGPRPAGFGWVPRHWEPRSAKAGVDPKLRSLWDRLHANPPPGAPKLPVKEMDPGFLNGAPAGQVIPFPKGGENVVLEHLHPTEQQFRFRLPMDAPRLRFDCGPGLQPVKVRVDTLTIEPDVSSLDVVWRGSLPAPEGVRMDQLAKAFVEVDGQYALPAPLLDTGFPIQLLTGGLV
jgi:hypothetical protein